MKIPDEAITLASALQFAGYKHVIATIWPISGLTAPDVARRVYDRIVVPGSSGTILDADGAAAALRSAIVDLIAESPGIPPLLGGLCPYGPVMPTCLPACACLGRGSGTGRGSVVMALVYAQIGDQEVLRD